MRQQRLLDDVEEEDRAERLAQAGEPDAQEALRASAAFVHSQPLDPPKSRQHRIDIKLAPPLKERPERQLPVPPEIPPPIVPKELNEDQEQAFKLMHLAFQKWARDFKKKPVEANLDLAVNLGGDTAIYLKNGIWKVADALDAINKLTGMNKRTPTDGSEAEELDAAIDKLRAEMRG